MIAKAIPIYQSSPVQRPPQNHQHTKYSHQSFKTVGSLLMILSVPSCAVATLTDGTHNFLMAIGLLAFGIGMTVFCVGRLRE